MKPQKLLAEFLGTYLLVWLGTGAVVANHLSQGAITHPGISLVFGGTVAVLVYVFGPISGAHINPAVSFTFWIKRELDGKTFLGYLLAQCTGAIAASGTLYILYPQANGYGRTVPIGEDVPALVMEIGLTFVLVLTVLRVAKGPQAAYTGWIVGALVAVEALFAGPLTGASMNPARSLGPALIEGHFESLWVYLLAPFVGAFLAHWSDTFLSE